MLYLSGCSLLNVWRVWKIVGMAVYIPTCCLNEAKCTTTTKKLFFFLKVSFAEKKSQIFSNNTVSNRQCLLDEPKKHRHDQVTESVSHTESTAIQAGLLTPLTFARHRLSPLAAFTSGAYFLHNGRRWQWICEFDTANFKGIYWGP